MNNLSEFLLGGAVGLVALLIYLGINALMQRRQSTVQRRLSPDPDESGILVRERDKAPKGFTDRIDSGFEQLTRRAGLTMPAEDVLATIFLVAVALAAGLYFWKQDLGYLTGGLLAGLFIPLGILWLMRGRYRGQLQEQLPDSFYLIARSLRAGMSMESAIELVANEGVKPLADEYKRAHAGLQLGLPLVSTLQVMAERLDLLDFNAFVSTVALHQTTGGNLPLLLDRLAASARDRNQFRGQFWAATAQGRITAIGLALAGPIILLLYLFLQPEKMQPFLTDARGWIWLLVVVIMEIIGGIWVYRVLKIDY